jgi:hypothetical protein
MTPEGSRALGHNADVMKASADAASPDIDTAVRLGWVVAELRGRSWPDGPRPATSSLPDRPEHTLPLRSQRGYAAAQRSAVHTLVALATQLGVDAEDAEASLADDKPWAEVSSYFFEFDARVQDSLAWRNEAAANGYLLARGLAECYWGLGPNGSWEENGEQTGVSLRFLFGGERRRELSRMLGRLKAGQMHALSGPAIAGSIEAWGKVAADPSWSRAPDLRDELYEQVRRWYQLLVLDQDPTTLVKPYAKLNTPHNFFRFMRLYRLQIIIGIVAILLITGFFAFRGQATGWLPSFFGIIGVGGAVVTGLLTRAQSTAQRLATRMRQDAYTDLVAVAVTSVPEHPDSPTPGSAIEAAVRRRLLTPATPPPD